MKKSIIILLHVGYWLLFLFLMVVVIFCMTVGMRGKGGFHFFNGNFLLLMFSFVIVPAVTGFYSFYIYLFSRFLKRRKIAGLFAFGFLTAMACGLTGAIAFSALVPYVGIFHDGWSSAIPITISMSIIALLNGGMALVINGFITWYAEIRLKEELSKKNYETELALIRSQLDPHFLFNTINNIDVLIGLDAARASAYLNKLSDIMRFMLYDTKAEKIPLSKELQYIEKYIDLQRIRTANESYVQYSATGDTSELMIAPMLFISFVENAFKHSEHKKDQQAINIRIAAGSDGILFECENRYDKTYIADNEYTGLGNELMLKRLKLLYPDHTLDIKKTQDIYSVQLQIKSHEN
ncbi:MAG: histidine kinase [Ferruginibacter sp.]